MKKHILIFLLIIFCTDIYSQNFSLKTGISSSNLTSLDINQNNNSRIGLVFGFVSETGEENIRYSYGLLFNQKGDNSVKYNIIDLHIKGNFYFNDEISLNIGPSFGYIISGQVENQIGDFQKIENWEEYNNRLDFNACLGMSYKINDLLTIEVSHQFGLVSVLNNSDLKTSLSVLSVSYSFDY